MASKDYQIKLLLTAINNASPVVKQMIKDMNHLENIEKKQRLSKKDYEKWWANTLNKRNQTVAEHNKKLKKASQEQDKINLDRRKKEIEHTSFWGKELDKRENASKKAAKEKQKIKTQEEQAVIGKRKSEVDYTSFWGKELDKRENASKKAAKQEEARIRNIERQQRQVDRNERRVRLQRYTDLSHAQESARAAMLYVSTPAAANAAFAIRNAMTMEQMGIRMRTQFGKDEGNMAFQEMKEYAAQTAFKLQEAVQLLSGMKVGQRSLGVSNTKELVSKSKSIGNVLLAYASSPEGRAEIAYQLSQVAMKGKANPRQDLMVMANYGLNVVDILERYTGKTFDKLQEKYGAELPAKLIFKALEDLSKSSKIIQAMNERSESLSQSWDTFGERVFFTSSAYGEVLDRQLGIKAAINSTSDTLQKMEAQMRGVSKESLNTKEQVLGYTTAMVIGIPALTFTLLTFKKLFSVASQTAGSTAALYRSINLAGLIVSGAYLTTVNWKDVIRDIDKEGFKGLLKHMDLLIIAAQIFATTMMFAFPGGFLAKGAGKLGGFLLKNTIGKAGGAVALGVGAYYAGRKGRETIDDYLTQIRNENAIEDYEKSLPKLQSTATSEDILKALKYGTTEMTPMPKEKQINLIVENNFSMEDGKIKGNTKVKRSAYENPLVSEAWQK